MIKIVAYCERCTTRVEVDRPDDTYKLGWTNWRVILDASSSTTKQWLLCPNCSWKVEKFITNTRLGD